jgi:carbon storage regulator
MLVLSRWEKESIVIGDRITVTVVKIRGNQVRLAIEAPKEIRVLRNELVDAPAAKIAAA